MPSRWAVGFALVLLPPLAGEPCVARMDPVLDSVRGAAYPEISVQEILVRPFASKSDYFRASPDWFRLPTGRRMRYVMSVNSQLCSLQAPEDGVRAIMAHELAHVVYYKRGSRWRLFGMVRYLSPQWRANFERGADRAAIHRGFGPGLKAYRLWLYRNVPPDKLPEKMRNYLSPDEIEVAVRLAATGQTGR